MSYNDLLRRKVEETGSILCMGMDPVLDKIPVEGDAEKAITTFYTRILDAIEGEDVPLNTVKPNLAFYEQYGFPGLRALRNIVKRCKDLGLVVIGDAKRGDIGKTSTAYANALYDEWSFDAITIAPYMGSDSVEPFVRDGKGQYVLCRTSNKGARDLQDLSIDGSPVYMKAAELIARWKTGAVVGATYIDELEELSRFFVGSGQEVPLLIPGVGTQGGSAADVVDVLKRTGNDLRLHRVNSSSGISYAYEKSGTDDFAGAAVDAIRKLHKDLRIE